MRKRRVFGRVFKRRRADGTALAGWYATWHVDGRKVQRYAGDTEREAEAFLAARMLELGRRPRDVKLSSFEAFVEVVKRTNQARLAPLTHARHSAILDRIAEDFSGFAVAEVGRAEVRGWLTMLRLERQLGPATVRIYVSVLSTVFRFAMDAGYARENPARGQDLPGCQAKEIPYVTVEELVRIYAAMEPEARPWAILLGETGIRSGEARDLTWSDVAPEFAAITVRRSKNYRPRTIRATPRLRALLQELWAARGATPMTGAGPVIPPITRHRLGLVLRRGFKKAGFLTLTPHGLRHVFCSQLVQAGEDLPTVQRLAGHASLASTMRYASHAPSDATTRGMDTLARFRGQLPPPRADRGDDVAGGASPT